MAKRSSKRTTRREKDRIGCMWGLICLFDFRIGRSTRQLISDRRRGSSRHVAGAKNSKRSVSLLTNGDDKFKEANTSTGNSPDDGEIHKDRVESIRISIKALLDEEMSNGPHSNNQSCIATEDHSGRNHKKINKPCKVSGDQESHNLKGHRTLESHLSKERFPEMEEICCQNHHHLESNHNNIDETDSCHTQNIPIRIEGDEPEMHLVTKEAVLGEKEGIAMESFLIQKFIDVKQLYEDESLVHKEFMDAIKIMNLNKELFLKLMQDPNSVLAKRIQELQDAEAGVKLLDKEKSDPVQCKEMVSHKQSRKQNIQSFFRRKEKDKCKKGNNNSPASSEIVVLKSVCASIPNSTSTTSPSSSPQSHFRLRNQVESEAVPSYFSLREIKRKWKRVTGENWKEQRRISMDGILHKVPYGHQDQRDLDAERETKTSFRNERASKPSTSKKKDTTDKQKTCELSTKHDVALPGLDTHLTPVTYAHQREANIYEQARKHLAEMVNTGDEDGESPTIRIPRTLGRILSMPEYMSPRSSPRKDEEPSSIPVQIEYFPNENSHCDSERVEASGEEDATAHFSHLSCNTDSSALNDHKQEDDEVKLSNSSRTGLLERLPNDTKIQESICIIGDPSQKGGVDFEEVTDVKWIEKSDLATMPSEPDNYISITEDHQSTDEAQNFEGKAYSECPKQESSEEICQEGSPSDSFLGSPLHIRETKDADMICEKAERPSPVSVLEPFDVEDVSGHRSPTVNRDELPLSPKKIHFDEENDSVTSIAPSDPDINSRMCRGEKKSELEYVKSVLEASSLTCQDFMGRCHSSDQLLDPSLYEETEASSTHSSDDQKLLFDCTNEVLMEVYERFYGCSPWVSFIKPNIRPMPPRKYVLQEVWKGIDGHLLQEAPCKPEQIVGKDMAKDGRWMDLRFDVESVGIELEESILEELLDETIYEVLF